MMRARTRRTLAALGIAVALVFALTETARAFDFFSQIITGGAVSTYVSGETQITDQTAVGAASWRVTVVPLGAASPGFLYKVTLDVDYADGTSTKFGPLTVSFTTVQIAAGTPKNVIFSGVTFAGSTSHSATVSK